MDKNRTIQLIMKHEGYREFLYNDLTGVQFKSDKGKLTIGYGYNIEERGLPLSMIKELLILDVEDIILNIDKVYERFSFLDSIRQAILIDMAYNLGISGLSKFGNMLTNLALKKYGEAASDMRHSLWSLQVKDRATELSTMMITGEWPDGIEEAL